ncbi:MAG TPA: N-acetylmuramidase domain-containing protein [Pyrinomonadaceae bacterium]|nr:N-acetylmuramidase domain-containing protein [Pyrinomonadaceae bacterium]
MRLEDIALHDLSIPYDSLKKDGQLTKQLQTLIAAAGVPVKGGADGIYGKNTLAAIQTFAAARGLPAGVVNKQFADALLGAPTVTPAVVTAVRTLTDADYTACATSLNCEVAAIRAVVDVESRGSGFLPDGRPKILFEALHFHRFTGGKYDKSHPNISSPVWKRSLYKGGAAEWGRLEEAAALDRTSAYKATSWGLFQIMGFNYQASGFQSVEDFVAAMKESEGAQLQAFANFVRNQKWDGFLRNRQWAMFAKRYNGPSYAQNHYDTKLADSYRKHLG